MGVYSSRELELLVENQKLRQQLAEKTDTQTKRSFRKIVFQSFVKKSIVLRMIVTSKNRVVIQLLYDTVLDGYNVLDSSITIDLNDDSLVNTIQCMQRWCDDRTNLYFSHNYQTRIVNYLLDSRMNIDNVIKANVDKLDQSYLCCMAILQDPKFYNKNVVYGRPSVGDRVEPAHMLELLDIQDNTAMLTYEDSTIRTIFTAIIQN